MTYGYYPGCSLEGISAEYDESMRRVLALLDVTIEDVPNRICCGTLAAPTLSPLLGLATPLWNVAQAAQAGQDEVIAPCSACLYHFKHAAKRVEENAKLRVEVEAVLELQLGDLPPIIHPLQLLDTDAYRERIKELAVPSRDFSSLKAVCYYGCHISRPAEVMQFDDPEDPQSMDRLLSVVGLQPLYWPGKVDCCGAHFNLVDPEVAVDMCALLFEAALTAGAEVIVVACPMCHANLDMRQSEVSAKLGRPVNMPILYFSQVLGYAFGLSPGDLGMKRHIISPSPLMLAKCQRESSQVVEHDYTRQ
jgi:heterodisulfide reductase subunit B